ncbi:DUF2378 family protein [Hyalangium minutum]|uniref:TIGR02265 family protein n=1 Tax=Hyalangium minutum TaxID=394096 RepID=A0A085WMV6_9BACT|nr:DUF2378 family protein [Hyalangium minutum]KFE69019.1 hypothetical protein DB31_6921 [Hyalangium minutum]
MNTPPVSVKPPSSEGGESLYTRYLSLPSPEDNFRGLFFTSLFNLVKREAGESGLKHCQQLLMDKRFQRGFISFATYPATDFLRLAHAATLVLAPLLGNNVEKCSRRLGMATVQDFVHSMAGKTLVSLSGGAPHRLLGNIPAAYRASVNFGERKMTVTGDKSALLTFKRDFLPLPHTEGVILAVMEVSTGKHPQVRSRSIGPLDSEYEVTWG